MKIHLSVLGFVGIAWISSFSAAKSSSNLQERKYVFLIGITRTRPTFLINVYAMSMASSATTSHPRGSGFYRATIQAVAPSIGSLIEKLTAHQLNRTQVSLGLSHYASPAQGPGASILRLTPTGHLHLDPLRL